MRTNLDKWFDGYEIYFFMCSASQNLAYEVNNKSEINSIGQVLEIMQTILNRDTLKLATNSGDGSKPQPVRVTSDRKASAPRSIGFFSCCCSDITEEETAPLIYCAPQPGGSNAN